MNIDTSLNNGEFDANIRAILEENNLETIHQFQTMYSAQYSDVMPIIADMGLEQRNLKEVSILDTMFSVIVFLAILILN